jgi:hypothetical protein
MRIGLWVESIPSVRGKLNTADEKSNFTRPTLVRFDFFLD